jgi:hypothetical protein
MYTEKIEHPATVGITAKEAAGTVAPALLDAASYGFLFLIYGFAKERSQIGPDQYTRIIRHL